jgi:hypothetical protein
MDLKLESRDDLLLATASGQMSLSAVLELHKQISDAAAERGFKKILFDCSAVTGEISVVERYQLGKTVAEHCLQRSMSPGIAVVGKPPTIDGLVARVAWNRGIFVETFSERQAAMRWLNGFGSRAGES